MPVDLTRLKTARENVAATERAFVENAQRQKEARAEIASLRRAGVRASRVNAAERRLRDLNDNRKTLLKKRANLQKLIDRLRNSVSSPPAFEKSIRGLSGQLPVTMLPVRLETRYNGDNSVLRVRIFPDTIHQDGHEPELTEQERIAATHYWEKRWASDDVANDAALWRNLARSFKPTRARWIVEAMTPTNVDDLGLDVPVFPEVPGRPQSWTRAARAQLLPERWLVLGYRTGSEVVRKWTAPVTDGLAMGPTPDLDESDDPTAEPPPVQEDLLFDEGMQWLVDYESAVKVGMAITISSADLTSGTLDQGFDLLMVVGVDWTQGPLDAAAALERQFDAHAFTHGLSFMPVGTPTNITDEAEGATTDPFVDPGLLDPTGDHTVANNSGSRFLANSFGLPNNESFDGVPGANNQSNQMARAMNNALWAPTWGYFLGQMMSPIVDDATIENVREHFSDHVRARGPFPTMRVGRQPYGVLPVMAPQRWKPLRTGLEQQLVDRVSPLRSVWLNASNDMPQLDTSNAPDETLVELLRFSPRSESFRFREAVGSVIRSNVFGIDNLGLFQETIAKLILSIAGIGGHPKLVDVTIDEIPTTLYVPLVQAGGVSETDELEDNYIARVLRQLNLSGGFKSLVDSPDSATSILEALIRHSAQLEFGKASWDLIVAEELKQNTIEAPVRFPPEIEIHVSDVSIKTGAEHLANVPKASVLAKGDTPLELALKRVNKVSGAKTIANHIAGQKNVALSKVPATSHIAEFRRALHKLRRLPSAELDRLAAETIDTTSHRLDAWITSLASRRLADLRSRGHEGTHLGGYGWVEDLRPNNQPASLGYVHAPSIAHATTASILRSGHLSHRDSDAEIFAIDLSSDRVALALELLEGVRQGQPIGALLGYRFERRIRERDPRLARFILEFRRAAPLDTSTDGFDDSEPLEAVAARDVVDGVKLIRKFKDDGAGLLNEVGIDSAEDRQAVLDELKRLVDSFDAVSDILVSESVYQAVLGNAERSGAALDAIDRQTGIPEVGIVKTPRTGHGVHHRLLVVLSDSTEPAAWPAIDARSITEPRLNAWLAKALGDPGDYVILVMAVVDNGGGPPTEVELSTSVSSLSMSPLSIVVSAMGGGGGRATELEERIVAVLEDRLPAGTTELRLSADPPTGEAKGFAYLMELATKLGSLVSSCRPASASDFVSATSRISDKDHDLADIERRLADIKRRADHAVASLRQARNALPATGSNATLDRIRRTLTKLADAGVRGAVPKPGGGEMLVGQLEAVRAAVDEVLKGLEVAEDKFDRSSASIGARRQHDMTRIAAVFGEHFPVLPLIGLPNGTSDDPTPHRDDLVASLASVTSLVDDNPLAATIWIQQHSLVRPGAQRLYDVLTAVEMAEGDIDATQFKVAQLPHIPDDRWVGLKVVENTPLHVGAMSLVMHAPDATDFAGDFAGFIADQWSDVIPSATETTAVGFHLDAPGARPPQSILLAVPPDPSSQGWSLDDLIDSVHEARELSRIRAVDLDFAEAVGRFLPATYLSFNLENKVPSYNFSQLMVNASQLTRTDGDG
ncbi:MAG: hypothetical protein GY811_24945 [Myxococcales bacterium]|nr:hypothetical protein [Myxococcales bacterium]